MDFLDISQRFRLFHNSTIFRTQFCKFSVNNCAKCGTFHFCGAFSDPSAPTSGGGRTFGSIFFVEAPAAQCLALLFLSETPAAQRLALLFLLGLRRPGVWPCFFCRSIGGPAFGATFFVGVAGGRTFGCATELWLHLNVRLFAAARAEFPIAQLMMRLFCPKVLNAPSFLVKAQNMCIIFFFFG